MFVRKSSRRFERWGDQLKLMVLLARCSPYIGKYLYTQSYHVKKYIMSAGWVFKGWIAWSKWFKKHYGVYPDQMYPGISAKLSRMSKVERDEIIMPELMKEEKINRVKIASKAIGVRKIDSRIKKLEAVKLY